MTKKLTIRLLSLLLIGCLLGGCAKGAKDKTFVKDEMSIVLTDRFSEDELAGQTAYYRSADSVVVILRDEFSGLGDLAVEDIDETRYADMVITSNGFESMVTVVEGLSTFDYRQTVRNQEFSYFAVTFKGDKAYYLVQFACEADRIEELKPYFIKWAKSFRQS